MLLIKNATNNWTKSWLFLPALYRKSAKLFVRKLYQKRTHLLQAYAVWNKCITASVCCANRIALSFVDVLHDRVSWKQLCWFLRCSAGKKKNQDFVQPLVAFPVSNISYCSPSLLYWVEVKSLTKYFIVRESILMYLYWSIQMSQLLSCFTVIKAQNLAVGDIGGKFQFQFIHLIDHLHISHNVPCLGPNAGASNSFTNYAEFGRLWVCAVVSKASELIHGS